MGVTDILPLLRRVRPTGKDRWIACCPAHEDRSPSMTIRVLPDGRILLHDFAGCETASILAALGLKFGDLFPDKLDHSLPRVRGAFSAHEALQCLSRESAIVALAASDQAAGKAMTPEQANRLALAAGRIATALEIAHG